MHKRIFVSMFSACVIMLGLVCPPRLACAWDVMSDTWTATDALGREMPLNDTTGDPRAGKFVGIFYFLWLGQHGTSGPYDLTDILTADPANPAWGPEHVFHHWGESQFGYYLSDDDYVVRKHAHELAAAGVDTLVLDVTNAFAYTSNYMNLCQIFQQVRDDGGDTPQICFIAYNGDYAATVQSIYDNLYSQNLYTDLWFQWDGKPLILTPSSGLSAEVNSFFTIRESWAWNWAPWFGTGQYKWPWLDDYPQSYGWDSDSGQPEEMSVAVASHPTRNRGRSFSNGSEPPRDTYDLTGLENLGLHFEEQWTRAHAVDPEFIYVTGWNEWVAQRFTDADGGDSFVGRSLEPGGTFFVDAYNQEYNRDIEPMKGGHSDNYYYQLVSHVRRHKGTRAVTPAQTNTWIDVDGVFSDWAAAAPEFRDNRGDAINRNHPGWGSEGTYVNNTARNDIDLAKIARDPYAVHFYVRTLENMTPYTDTNWMVLLINADRDYATGWNGYDYAVNRTATTANTALLEANTGGWNWAPVGTVSFAVTGTEMEMTIPREYFGSHAMDDFEFKWSDNMQEAQVTTYENTENWTPDNSVGPLSAPDGVLTFDVTANDPFVGSPPFSIDAATNPYITIRMKAPISEGAQIFWHTAAEPYPTQQKSIVWTLGTAGEWQEYVLDLTGTSTWTGTITGLRLDPYGGTPTGQVETDYVRVCSAPATGSNPAGCPGDGITWEFTPTDDRPMQWRINGDVAPDLRFNYHFVYEPSTSAAQRWDFNTEDDFEGWNLYQHMTNESVSDGTLSFTVNDADPYMFSPSFAVPSSTVTWFIVRLRNLTSAESMQLYWTNEAGGPGTPGNDTTFAIQSNRNAFVEYAVDLSGLPDWTGTISQLRLDPASNGPTGRIEIDYMALWDSADLPNPEFPVTASEKWTLY